MLIKPDRQAGPYKVNKAHAYTKDLRNKVELQQREM